MKKYFFLLVLILLLVSITINAQVLFQTGSPEWLVNKFFAEQNFPDKGSFFIDEMIDQISYPSIGEELKGEAKISQREIERSSDEAVFSVNISKINEQKDFYCYLKNKDGWKISAIRAFILPGYVHLLADSIMRDPDLPDSTKSIVNSIRLLSGTDENLKEYFKINFNEFKNLLELFNSEKDSEIKLSLQKLNLSGAYKLDQLSDCIYFSILEVNYLDAGYIYCTDKSKLPEIDPNKYIIVDEVIKDWYIYRRN